MHESYDKAVTDILKKVHVRMKERYHIGISELDRMSGSEKFVDDCRWAMHFGGRFKREILSIAEEILEEDE